MTNSSATVTSIYAEATNKRFARASFVGNALKSERWSTRQAALALGMSHSSLGDRLKGNTSFLAEDIEDIATLLKRDPVEFYADYLAVGPTGLEPMTSTV